MKIHSYVVRTIALSAILTICGLPLFPGTANASANSSASLQGGSSALSGEREYWRSPVSGGHYIFANIKQ